MYKLYGYAPNLKLLLISFDEEKIIEEINKYIYIVDNIHFIIILQTSDRMTPYKTIFNENDFLNYIDEYRNKYIRKEKKR